MKIYPFIIKFLSVLNIIINNGSKIAKILAKPINNIKEISLTTLQTFVANIIHYYLITKI